MGPLGTYDRAARLTPLLLALAPIPLTTLALGWERVTWLMPLATFAVSWAVAVLGAQIARDAGRRLEPRLFQGWGGPPTTVLLRHRGPLTPATRAHLHAAVSKATGIALPTSEAEEADPLTADDTYAAAVSSLRELTRDPARFPPLSSELANYGMRRNLFGLRPLGSAVAALATGVTGSAATAALITRTPFPASATLLAFGLNLCILVAWRRYATAKWVRRAAFTYAESLLHAASGVEPRAPSE